MNKANLFIVGAMKAGTTSLAGLLSAHQSVYGSPIKEPNYFVDELPVNLYESSRFFSEKRYFENDFPKPVHIANLKEAAHYDKLFSLADTEKYLLDASTSYLHAPNTAKNIATYNPDAKIIIITRTPLARAFSHYKMDKGLGRVKKPFETIIENEIKAYKQGVLPWNSYLGMSFYKPSIDEYRNLFKAVLVIDFETFIKNRDNVLKELTTFLGIDFLHDIEDSHQNKTRSLRFQKLFYFLKKLGLKDYFSKILSQKFRQRLFNIVSSETEETIQLSVEIQEEAIKILTQESS